MEWMKIKDLFQFQKKSKIKAGEGQETGKYIMFTSSMLKTKYLDDYQFDEEALILGTGGNPSIHYCNDKFSTSTDCFVLTSKVENLLPKFVYLYLKGNLYILEEGFKGAGLKHISQQFIKDIKIPIPSMEEQEKIVKILDEAQNLIDKRKEQIDLMDELTESIFYEMFGDPVKNEKGWKVEKLGKLANLKAGKNKKAAEINKEYENGLYPCYGGNGIRGYVSEFSHEGNYNLIGRQGALCGNVQYATNQFYATEHAVVVTLIVELNSLWLNKILVELKLNRLATGAAQPGLTVGKLNEVDIPVPPLSLQNEFAEKMKAIEEQKKLLEKSLNLMEDNYNSLMQKAFNTTNSSF